MFRVSRYFSALVWNVFHCRKSLSVAIILLCEGVSCNDLKEFICYRDTYLSHVFHNSPKNKALRQSSDPE